MSLIYKRILAAAVSVTVIASGTAAYLKYADVVFDPNKYSINDKLNKNQITFNDDNDDHSDPGGDNNDDGHNWEQDDAAQNERGSKNKPNASVLFKSPVDGEQPKVAAANAQTDGGSGNDKQSANSGEQTVLVSDGDGSNGSAVVSVPGGGGSSSNGSDGGSNGGSDGNGNGSDGNGSDTPRHDPNPTPSPNPTPTPDPTPTPNPTPTPTPDPTPTPTPDPEPSYDNDYQEPDPDSPSDVYDNIFPSQPIPDGGIEEEENADPPELSVITLAPMYNIDCIYYGEKLTAWKLLCATNVHVTYDNRFYRLTELGDNFKITEFPNKVTGTFTAMFSFRLNSNSDWVVQEVEFTPQPYKVVVADYDHKTAVNSKEKQYPEEGESVDLMQYYINMYGKKSNKFYSYGDEIDEIFLGWSENNGGDPIYYDYTPTKKGLTALYPLGTVDLPSDFKAEIGALWNEHDHFCYVQTLTDYTGKSKDIAVPEGIQKVDMFAAVDSIDIPASVMSIMEKLAVSKAYNVAEDNAYYSDVNGVLYNKAQTELIAVPEEKKYMEVPKGVKHITLNPDNQLTAISLLSETPPTIDLSKLHGATIYVPDSAYLTYMRKWSTKLGKNKLRPRSQNTHENYYYKDGSILLDTDEGTALCGVTEYIKGFYVVPDGVTEIRSDAFTGSDISAVVLPESITEIDDKALSDLNNAELYFLSDTAPSFGSGNFFSSRGTAAISRVHVPIGSESAYTAILSPLVTNISDIIVGEDFSLVSSGGYNYFKETDGCTLLSAPEDLVFYRGTLPNGEKLKAIANRAFSHCPTLRAVELTADTKYILDGAFDGCKALEQLVCLSKDVINVSCFAFDDADNLTIACFNAASAVFEDGYVPANSKCGFYRPYDSYGYASNVYEYTWNYKLTENAEGVTCVYAYDDDGLYFMSASSNMSGEFYFEDGTVEVAGNSFINCQNTFTIRSDCFENLQYLDDRAFYGSALSGDIVLGNNLLMIGKECFKNCTGITSVYIDPAHNISNLSSGMFYGCTSLANIEFAEDTSITGFGNELFMGCAAERVVLPKGLTELPYATFADSPNLKELVFQSETAPRLLLSGEGSKFMFTYRDGVSNDVKITVPEGCEEEYFRTWRYEYMGYTDLYSLCYNYYINALWDGLTAEEIANKAYNEYTDSRNELRTMLGLDTGESEIAYEEFEQQVKEIEEEFSIW